MPGPIRAAEAPEGFDYRSDFLSVDEERELAERIAALEFSEVRMHGVAARRRTAHFGWLYGYESYRLTPGPAIPSFLEPVRERAAPLLGVAARDLEEALVTEYTAGATIGWHRDAPMFGPAVVGISLVSACRMRFRRKRGDAWETFAAVLEPRSAYVLSGPARTAWQHSIPPTRELRYSITFRTLRRSR